MKVGVFKHAFVTCCLQEIDGCEGNAFDPAVLLPKAVSNIISSIIFGSRFEYEDETFKGSTQTVRFLCYTYIVDLIDLLIFVNEFFLKKIHVDFQFSIKL